MKKLFAAVTINAARVMGVDQRVGSLEKERMPIWSFSG